jgi:hypothetical protein
MIRRRKKKAGTTEQDLLAYFASKVSPAKIQQTNHEIALGMSSGFLVCKNCTRVQDLTVELLESYLANGWPVCCPGTPNGGTMSYCRAEERKRG